MGRVIVLLLLAAPLLAAETDAVRDRLKSRDAAERRAAVGALAKTPGEEASRLIAGAFADRDPSVREAAVKAMAGRTDEAARKALRQALARFAKDADLLPVVVIAVGDSGAVEAAKDVADLLRKSLGADPRLARAAIEALGGLPSAVAVETLVATLSAATDARAPSHPEYREDLLDSLRQATGLPFREPATFVEWWRNAKRDYRGTPAAPPAEGTLYRSDGWRFTIERPKDRPWEFKRVDGTAIRIAWIGPREEAAFAWVDVIARSAREPATTLEDAATGCRGWMEETLRDPRDAEWGRNDRLGGAPAVRHQATGLLDGGSVVRWRAFVLERGGILYTVSVHLESGAAEAVTADADAILASFRLLDG